MSDEPVVREMLEQAAREVVIVPVDPEPLVRRARRRLARTVAVLLAGTAVAIGVAVGSAGLLRAAPPSVPAVPGPTITPGPIPPRMNNGPLTLIRPGHIEGESSGALIKPLIQCGRRCSVIKSASWTSDGTKLAFVAECGGACTTEGDPYHGIRVFDVRTGDDRLIAPGDEFGLVDWSPDGTRIAFTGRSGTSLSIMNADGSNVRTIPMLEGIVSGPIAIESIAWSPDGTRIAYSTFPDEQMYVETIDGSSQTALGLGREPDWSPDGTRIAYASLDRCEIWTMSPEGSQRRKVAQVTHPGHSACGPRSLVPAGQRDHHGISGFSTLENVAWQPGPTWSPDGRMIAFTADRGLFTVRSNGSDLRRVSGADPYEAIAWRPVP